MNPRPISFDAAIALGGTPGRDDVFLSWALERSRVVVAADVGADRVLEVGHVPDWVIGDFDSFDGRQLSETVRTLRFACDKDYTDGELATAAAILLACGREVCDDPDRLYARAQREAVDGRSFCFLNPIGSRSDHTLANLFLACAVARKGAEVTWTDGTTWAAVLVGPTDGFVMPFQSLPFEDATRYLFSIQPMDDRVTGVSLDHLKWALTDVRLPLGRSLGISNEPMANHPAEAKVRLASGTAMALTFPETL